MSIRNKVQLVGHAGMNPEIKVFGNNQKLARLSIATNESYKNQAGQWVENTTWHTLVAWRNIAERIEKQVNKGSYLMIEGKLINRQYENDKNEKRYITEVEVRSFLVLDKKEKQSTLQPTSQMYTQASAEDDDLPF